MRVSVARLLPLPALLETKYHAKKAEMFHQKNSEIQCRRALR